MKSPKPRMWGQSAERTYEQQFPLPWALQRYEKIADVRGWVAREWRGEVRQTVEGCFDLNWHFGTKSRTLSSSTWHL